MAFLDNRNRAPSTERLPDMRLRVTRLYDVLDITAKDPSKLASEVWLNWGTADEVFTNTRLVKQDVSGHTGVDPLNPTAIPPKLVRTYEEIPANDQIIVGNPAVSFDQYGNKTVAIDYLQFSAGTSTYSYEVGVTAAPAPFADCYLQFSKATDDGTLIRTTRTFIDKGQLSDNERLLFGGKLLLRELKYLNEVPPTPTGWTLVTQSTEFINGLPVYTYGFSNSSAAGGGGIVGYDERYSQSVDLGVTKGVTIYTIRQLTALTQSTNPVSSPPASSILIRAGYEDDQGYRMWTVVYAKGLGRVDTVTTAREDGSLVYDVTELGAAAAIPAYPGSGTGYNTTLSQEPNDGYFVNRARWIKPPGSRTIKTQIDDYPLPGLAYFIGTQLILQPPVKRRLIADVVIDFDTTQVSTAPFQVTSYASFFYTYTTTETPTVPSQTVQGSQALTGYLASGSTVFGTDADYNGVLCDSYSATRVASSPTALPSGSTVLAIKNTPYLTDLSGVVIYQREVTSFTF
jgi:hypothetical protein